MYYTCMNNSFYSKLFCGMVDNSGIRISDKVFTTQVCTQLPKNMTRITQNLSFCTYGT